MKTPFNKYLYIGFILLGSYQALFNKDYMQAVASFGIGLAFDPFNSDQKWKERPIWQKTVLLSHITLIGILISVGLTKN
jgi:hypothetical protein